MYCPPRPGDISLPGQRWTGDYGPEDSEAGLPGRTEVRVGRGLGRPDSLQDEAEHGS